MNAIRCASTLVRYEKETISSLKAFENSVQQISNLKIIDLTIKDIPISRLIEDIALLKLISVEKIHFIVDNHEEKADTEGNPISLKEKLHACI